MIRNSRWGFLLLVVVGLVSGGCATTESENLSERPWNAPQSWESGTAGSMFNQYR
ncbi:MAG TPA: hypothetical protein P5205_01015 [Candidatus Paceibacterota bacterium]|nr:hypothetical protein [Verrucomicrobiota bacterium]HSA08931.1 hypothetical protein [Candidatus Paceibacterota bacterium]